MDQPLDNGQDANQKSQVRQVHGRKRKNFCFAVGSEWHLRNKNFPAAHGELVVFLGYHEHLTSHGYVECLHRTFCVPLKLLCTPRKKQTTQLCQPRKK